MPVKYPMLMTSVFKNYLWGGTKLRDVYGKRTELVPIAESWELSCHRDGLSVIANGQHAGMTLAEYVSVDMPSVLGGAWNGEKEFPLLVKLIDAQKPLSVQVHPDDAYAAFMDNDRGKAEAWYVIAAEPGASIVYGVNRELDKAEFRTLISQNRLGEVLNHIFVHPGDVFFVPPGTLHAIGGGVLIAEVQQSSNATYRVWDYGRTGTDGKPRTLHIDKALEVSILCPSAVPAVSGRQIDGGDWRKTFLIENSLFSVSKMLLSGRLFPAGKQDSFESMTCLAGGCVLNWSGGSLSLHPGETVFLPAGLPPAEFVGSAEFLIAGR